MNKTVLFILLLLFVSGVALADRTVEEDGGGDHLTLDDALDNVVAGNTITIQGEWDNPDTVACIVSTNCTITAEGAARVTTAGHVAGVPLHYRLHCAGGGHCITVTDATASTTIDGIEIKQGSAVGSDECIRLSDDGGVLNVTNCIIYSASGASDQDGVYAGDIGATVNCENLIVYNVRRSGLHPQIWQGTHTQTWNIVSCSMYNCGENNESEAGGVNIQIRGDATYFINIHNSWALDCSFNTNDSFGELVLNPGPSTWGISYSIADDTSPTDRDGTGAGNQENVEIFDTDQGAGAYVIVNGDIDGAIPWDLALTDLDNTKNVAQDEHAQEGAEDMDIPGTDIDGTARPANTNYDVGAFEIPVAGATPTSQVTINMF